MPLFRRKKQSNLFTRILQSLTAGTALILFWRGAWGLLDTYLFPNHPIMSYIASLLLGLFILFIDDFELNEIHSRH